VISAISLDVFVLELGEDEGSADDLGELAGAGGGVLEQAQRWVSGANPRSPWKRRPHSRKFLACLSGASSWLLPGLLTGMWMPIPAPW
jgi:hypothetical protein